MPPPIPWISYLAPGQETANGIIRSTFSTETPASWFLRTGSARHLSLPKAGISQQTQPRFNSASLKLVQRPSGTGTPTYLLPILQIDSTPAQVTVDLDRLVERYLAQLSSAAQTPADKPDVTSLVLFRLNRRRNPTRSRTQQKIFLLSRTNSSASSTSGHARRTSLLASGPPGVGKTFFSRRLAYALFKEKAPERVGVVQFHQSYSYEDFVQGYRPSREGFIRKNGLFYDFCEQARDDNQRKYVFIIDEVNRGNVSKIFGELLMLVEADKRSSEWEIPLAYSRNSRGDVPRFRRTFTLSG